MWVRRQGLRSEPKSDRRAGPRLGTTSMRCSMHQADSDSQESHRGALSCYSPGRVGIRPTILKPPKIAQGARAHQAKAECSQRAVALVDGDRQAADAAPRAQQVDDDGHVGEAGVPGRCGVTRMLLN